MHHPAARPLTRVRVRRRSSAAAAAVLVLEVCRTLPPSALPLGLMLLAHLALTQEHLARFPDRAFKHLAKVRVRAWMQGSRAAARAA